MDASLCCQNEINLSARQSPFSKLIALSYYDGPTSGLIICGICSREYKFDVLAIDVDGKYDHVAWDQGEELRIFKLSSIPLGSFNRLTAILSRASSPRWPEWVFITKQNTKLDESELNAVLSLADDPTIVVIASNLLEKILQTRIVKNEQINQVTDWFSFLGVG